MNSYIKTQKGSVVIETAIYMPFIIIVILAVFIYGALWYQQSVLQEVSQHIADICSQQLRDPAFSKLIETQNYHNVTILDYSNHHPYRYLFLKDNNLIILKNQARKLIGDSVIGKNNKITINIYRNNYFVTNNYTVKISQEFVSPINLSILGLPDKFYLSEKCHITVTDPTEFIRNTDLAFDVMKYIDDKTKVSETIKNLFDKAKKVVKQK